ncbi:hypothetical protein [Collimonas pratensis]|uniref:hypothetical protein n=1 Tax=Collimonas pratensis TaxID=279113 RepID=UPI0007814139|nr:hypothetical protein [Collimonas pratensis]
MNTHFIEVTIRSDSKESVGAPTRKGSIRVDQITTFVDMHEYYGEFGAKTIITLLEPDDQVDPELNGDGTVFRSVRTLQVEDTYEAVKKLIRGNVD